MFSNWLAKFLKIQQLTLMSKQVQAHHWPSCFETNFFLCISSMLLSSFSFSPSSLLMAFCLISPFCPIYWALTLCAEHVPCVIGEAIVGETSHTHPCSVVLFSGTRRKILLWLALGSYSHIPSLVTHWLWMEVIYITARLKDLIDGMRLLMLFFPAAVISEKACVKTAEPKVEGAQVSKSPHEGGFPWRITWTHDGFAWVRNKHLCIKPQSFWCCLLTQHNLVHPNY